LRIRSIEFEPVATRRIKPDELTLATSLSVYCFASLLHFAHTTTMNATILFAVIAATLALVVVIRSLLARGR